MLTYRSCVVLLKHYRSCFHQGVSGNVQGVFLQLIPTERAFFSIGSGLALSVFCHAQRIIVTIAPPLIKKNAIQMPATGVFSQRLGFQLRKSTLEDLEA